MTLRSAPAGGSGRNTAGSGTRGARRIARRCGSRSYDTRPARVTRSPAQRGEVRAGSPERAIGGPTRASRTGPHGGQSLTWWQQPQDGPDVEVVNPSGLPGPGGFCFVVEQLSAFTGPPGGGAQGRGTRTRWGDVPCKAYSGRLQAGCMRQGTNHEHVTPHRGIRVALSATRPCTSTGAVNAKCGGGDIRPRTRTRRHQDALRQESENQAGSRGPLS
jgi:hypothetical protein